MPSARWRWTRSRQANSGHPGLPMGVADVATVLFTRFLKFDPTDPAWPDRDRFVLSAGHGSMLLYALLYLLGYEKMTIAEIKRFRQLGSLTPGHPEHGHTPGVETTTGPLGQGHRYCGRHGDRRTASRRCVGGDVVDHKTYVLASDGDLMEGISQEAIALAGHLKLKKLIVLFDDNHISIDGPTSLSDSVDQVERFKSAGWAASRIDGHDPQAIAAAIEAAQRSDKPTMIACRTTIGFGAPTQGRHRKDARLPARRRGDRRRAARSSAGLRRRSKFPPTFSHQWRAAGARGKPVARRPGSSGSPRSTRASAPNSSGGLRGDFRRQAHRGDQRDQAQRSRTRRRRSPPARRPNSRSTL